MNQKKFHRLGKPGLSVGNKIAATFIGITILSMLLLFALNHLFLEPYYRSQKSDVLKESFAEVNELSPVSLSDVPDSFEQYCFNNNITMILLEEDLSTPIFYNTLDRMELQTLMFGLLMGNEEDQVEPLSQGDNYQIHLFLDKHRGAEFLQIVGWLDNGAVYLARIPLESIRDSVKLSNRFYLFVGMAMVALGGFVIWFLTRQIVRPLEELADLSKRMAALDFDARYTSGGSDEIGQLGENFNHMSETLESVITELKTANLKLQKDIEEKVQLDEMRREFLGNVTHELKTPIALIQGYAEGLKDNISDDAESREFYCDVIIDEASRMNTMVKQLLALNQLESGQDEITMERFDIKEVITGVLNQSSILLEQSGADVRFLSEPACPVWADEFKVEQMITNYLTNAIHHLDFERVISIDVAREDDKVKITVFNTGEQIPEEDREKIWNKFYKVDKARTRAYGGTGIGLSIVKAICDSLHQECGCTNYENGVAFWFTLDNAGADVPEEA